MAKYLYNGLELPALPEYDSTKYPYVYIVGNIGATTGNVSYDFACCDKPLVYKKPLLVNEFVVSLYGNGGTFDLKGDEWVLQVMDTELSHYYYKDNFNFLWSNHNIINKSDGSVYLAASDPVPVGGEPETPEQPTLTERDLYRKINGQPTKLTLYKKVSGELVKVDEYSAVSATDV